MQHPRDPLRLQRASHRPPVAVEVTEGMAFVPGRVHEICGAARHGLALRVMARRPGPVIWIGPAWRSARLNPDGACLLADPARIVHVDCRRAEDILWCLEETLRAGAVALAVAELPDPPGLTPVRRLTLAAEAGTAATGRAPLGLLLTPGDGGAAGVESRWRALSAHAAGITRWQIDRLRARTAPPCGWIMDDAGRLQPRDDASRAAATARTGAKTGTAGTALSQDRDPAQIARAPGPEML